VAGTWMGKAAFVALAGVLVAGCGSGTRQEKGIVVGESSSTSTAAEGPTIPVETTTSTEAPTTSTQPAPPPVDQFAPDGAPYGAPLAFNSAIPVPQELQFVLVIGSDARPGQDPRSHNGDAIHLLAIDPRTGSGTIIGFPRDSWVEIPGKGTRKINSALALGGPKLMAETIRHLTGLPVHYYVVTGFEGFRKLVDDMGGLNVKVDRRMNDSFSGAKFNPGWHKMMGGEALAYARNRHDVPSGDFGRSEHQGNLILSGLAKLRAEVSDDAGIRQWIGVLMRHVSLDTPPPTLEGLGALARNLDPAKIKNVVLQGRIGNASGQSVVFLTDAAKQIFLDLRPDAILGGAAG
jgi:polyisoprenyl-teichoic acid--peptidoglycan teichoic acid transferase